MIRRGRRVSSKGDETEDYTKRMWREEIWKTRRKGRERCHDFERKTAGSKGEETEDYTKGI